MNEQQIEKITVGEKEYNISDLTQDQRAMVEHIVSIDNKLNNIQFEVTQLQVGRSAFLSMLQQSLEQEIDGKESD